MHETHWMKQDLIKTEWLILAKLKSSKHQIHLKKLEDGLPEKEKEHLHF